MSEPTTKEQLRQRFEHQGVRRIKVGGFDVDGVLRGKYISLDKFWSAIDKGFGFCDVIFGWDVADALYDNAELTGWHSGYPDTLARIDLDSFRVLPSEPTTAHFIVDFWRDNNRPHPACPRNLLKTVIARAEAAGLSPRFSCEFEFWVFRESVDSLQSKRFSGLQPLSPGMYGYSWVREGQHAALWEDVLEQLAAYRIDVEGLHTETGPGVYEVALSYSDALAAADAAALFKTTMKLLCASHDCAVTFMAKWHPELPGSSGHIHQSMWSSDGTTNLFADPKADDGLSQLARHYLAGLLTLSPDLTALFSPTVNAYKRYVPGMWAPLTASWGIENRTCSVRAINTPSAASTRLEFRQTAADINPYLAIAGCLASGLYGVERALTPPPASRGDATETEPDSPLRLPVTLGEATRKMRDSELAYQVLPEEFVKHYVRTRDWEVREFNKSVSQWELARYFEAV